MEVADDVILERFFEIRRFLRLFFRRFANTVLLLTFRSIYECTFSDKTKHAVAAATVTTDSEFHRSITTPVLPITAIMVSSL